MKKATLWLLAACLVFVFSGCTRQETKINQIKARNNGAGELRVGVKVDVPNFGYINPDTGVLEGLEIDLAKEMAAMITGNSEAIRFVPTTGMAKESLISNGEVDLVIGTYTITDARKEVVNFSRPYYIDEIGFMVLGTSAIRDLADFPGKTIGVTRASTAFSAFDQHPEVLGEGFILKGFASYPEIQDALLSSTIDVFAADKSILSGYNSKRCAILDPGVQPQPYGIGSLLADKTFAKEVDTMLEKLMGNGTLDAILAKWLH